MFCSSSEMEMERETFWASVDQFSQFIDFNQPSHERITLQINRDSTQVYECKRFQIHKINFMHHYIQKCVRMQRNGRYRKWTCKSSVFSDQLQLQWSLRKQSDFKLVSWHVYIIYLNGILNRDQLILFADIIFYLVSKPKKLYDQYVFTLL